MHSSRMHTAHSLTVSCSICSGVCVPDMPPLPFMHPAMHTPHHAYPLPCMPPATHAPPPHIPPLPCMPPSAMHTPCHTHPHHAYPHHTCPLPCTGRYPPPPSVDRQTPVKHNLHKLRLRVVKILLLIITITAFISRSNGRV